MFLLKARSDRHLAARFFVFNGYGPRCAAYVGWQRRSVSYVGFCV
jgi:hypothetical protein